MPIPSLEDLLASACHFGHPKRKWNPKMAPYIYGTEKGVHIFDLTHTRGKLEEMCEALKTLQAEGKTILFVSTKQQSTALIEKVGKAINQPSVTKKWIGGLLTNWKTLKKRIQYYLDLKSSFQTGDVEKYTKKEQTKLRKEMLKLDDAISGVSGMREIPDALFVIDALRDNVAVREANLLKIPVYGICDSNANPDQFTCFVPANDDAIKSIEIILNTVQEELMNAKETKATKKTNDTRTSDSKIAVNTNNNEHALTS